MKTKLLFFLLILLATGGSLFAQDFIQNYNFVTTGTKGPGTSFANTGVSSFFMSWSPQTSMNTCSVQADSSSDGSSWGSGDLIASQSCTTVGSAAIATLGNGKNFVRVNVTVMSGNGGLNVTLKGWGGGAGGAAANFGASAIFATASKYGAKFDAHFIDDASITNTSNSVTSATAGFLTSASVGQSVWAISQPSGLTGTVVLPIGTITVIDSNTQIHVSTTATATQTALLFWGTKDTTALQSFWTDATNNANGQTCGILPSGMAIVDQSVFTDSSSTRRFSDCLYSPGFFTLIVSPDMNWATCPTATSGCFWNHPNQIAIQQPNSDYIANIEVWGGGYNWASLGSTNSIMFFQRATVVNVWVWGIGEATGSGLTGMNFTGPDQVFESVVYSVNKGCNTNNSGGNQTVALYASFCGGHTNNLSIGAGAYVSSIGSQYGPNVTSSGVSNNGFLYSSGDAFLGSSGTSFTVTTGNGGVTHLDGSQVTNSGVAGTSVLVQTGGTFISTGLTTISASGGGGANAILIQGTGTFRTDGNIRILSGVTNIAPACTFSTGGGTSPSCAIQAGSTNEKGVIIASTGTGSPGSQGTITLTFAGTFTGTTAATPACTYTLDNSGTAWANGALVQVNTQSTTAPTLAWTNFNATTPALAVLSTSSPYRIGYVCTPR